MPFTLWLVCMQQQGPRCRSVRPWSTHAPLYKRVAPTLLLGHPMDPGRDENKPRQYHLRRLGPIESTLSTTSARTRWTGCRPRDGYPGSLFRRLRRSITGLYIYTNIAATREFWLRGLRIATSARGLQPHHFRLRQQQSSRDPPLDSSSGPSARLLESTRDSGATPT